MTEPDAWILHPGDAWHGFSDLEDRYAMLDPIKVSVITPGIHGDGWFAQTGIPAELATTYLDAEGIQVEKTADYTILFLFTSGLTKGKWGTPVNALPYFKRDYDANASIEQIVPRLAAQFPERYGRLGLRDLAREMHDQIRQSQQIQWQEAAVSQLPLQVTMPADAYQRLVQNEIQLLPLSKMADRTVATGVVPYPPRIPLLMRGERR